MSHELLMWVFRWTFPTLDYARSMLESDAKLRQRISNVLESAEEVTFKCAVACCI